MLEALEWIVLGTAGAAGIVIGVLWHRPARIGPWLLLAGSVTTLAVGDVLYAFGRRSAAEWPYLAMFVLVALSLLRLTRGGSLLGDRARLIDLLACTCATLLVAWVFVIDGSGRFGRIPAADVIGDLMLLCVAGRVIRAARRNWSAVLLGVGSLGLLTGDILYAMAPGPLTEAPYVVLYLAWGSAALHPSMTELTEPVAPRPTPWRGSWAALLGLSVATPPTVLLIEAVTGPVRNGVVIAVAGGITLLLTITRLVDSLTQHSQALTRERGLREASATLVAAPDPAAVDAAVRAAIAVLMPAAAVHRVVFAADDQQLTDAVTPGSSPAGCPAPSLGSSAAPSPAGPAAPPSAGSRSSAGPRSSVAPAQRASSSLSPAAGSPFAGGSQGLRSWWMTGGEDSGGGTGTLVCPLWLEPLASARPGGGALVLTGRRDVLAATRDALEVLAGQAALALERITLVEAVGRRDSELYLRAVIRNTADAMVVTDEDGRIRYVSPGLLALLGGEEQHTPGRLTDLVHPDDRPMIREALNRDGDGTLYCALQRPDGRQVLVEAAYRDLRGDRLVRGFVLTVQDITDRRDPSEHLPYQAPVDVLPAWINRRSAQHKFRF